jgi:hypothetical protein
MTSRNAADTALLVRCPACKEIVGVFRNHVFGLDSQILEKGTKDERIAHWAAILDEVWTSIQKGQGGDEGEPAAEANAEAGPAGDATPEEPDESPISESEVERFMRVQLPKIDDPAYFRRHFG